MTRVKFVISHQSVSADPSFASQTGRFEVRLLLVKIKSDCFVRSSFFGFVFVADKSFVRCP